MSLIPFPQPEMSEFDEWWQLQFHKTGKVIAKAKWDAITSPQGCQTRILDKSTNEYIHVHLQASPQEILDAQKRQNKAFFERHGYNNEREKQFLPRPVTWLNRGGFLDD